LRSPFRQLKIDPEFVKIDEFLWAANHSAVSDYRNPGVNAYIGAFACQRIAALGLTLSQ
jgi:hypothetical protein